MYWEVLMVVEVLERKMGSYQGRLVTFVCVEISLHLTPLRIAKVHENGLI